MSIELKVKFCSLAEEAKIIRRFERRALKAIRKRGITKPDHPWYLSVRGHRKGVVRWEARHTHLARMFLRGMPYDRVEKKCRVQPDWKKIFLMAERYGTGKKEPNGDTTVTVGDVEAFKDRFDQWCGRH